MARLSPLLPLAALLLAMLLCTSPASAIRTVHAGPKVVEYKLTVTYGYWAPDCVTRQMYLINGQYPGPTITATEGDTLIVKVKNELSMEGLSVHWHGIRQLNNNLMDGVDSVTQCAISPMDYMIYNMTLDKAGTFMYHGHLDFQVSAGLYGSLIVKDRKPPPFKYDGEFDIILNDWYHRSIYEMVLGLDSIPFGWIGEAQSLLLNGKGQYNCSLVPVDTAVPNPAVVGDVKICNSSSPFCTPRTTLVVESGKTYRLRLASIATLEAQNLVIANHKLTVVAADSYEVKPFVVGPEGLDVYAGQTVDVLFTANQPGGTYWIRTGVVARNAATPFGLGILQYATSSSGDPTAPPPPIRAWNDSEAALKQAEQYKALDPAMAPVPKWKDRTVVLTGAQQKVNGYIKWAVNDIALKLPPIPYVFGIPAGVHYGRSPPDMVPLPWNYSSPSPFNATYGSAYFKFPYNQVIDIVIQNTNNLGPGASEYHPWHMHGHQFWVLAYGNGAYNETTDSSTYNLVDPPFRNTVTVMPYGWVALRFKADNPGVWLFHCHIGAHLHMGMAIVFKTGNIENPSPSIPRCGFHSV